MYVVYTTTKKYYDFEQNKRLRCRYELWAKVIFLPFIRYLESRWSLLTMCSLGSRPTWCGGIPKRSLSIWEIAAGFGYSGNWEGCIPLQIYKINLILCSDRIASNEDSIIFINCSITFVVFERSRSYTKHTEKVLLFI